MPDRENVMRGLECCCTHIVGMSCGNCPYEIEQREDEGISDCTSVLAYDALALLKEQEALLHEYEKLSQVCFKIEKYLRIADLSILIDRIEEGKVKVLQDDGRPDAMETTIKIRRL